MLALASRPALKNPRSSSVASASGRVSRPAAVARAAARGSTVARRQSAAAAVTASASATTTKKDAIVVVDEMSSSSSSFETFAFKVRIVVVCCLVKVKRGGFLNADGFESRNDLFFLFFSIRLVVALRYPFFSLPNFLFPHPRFFPFQKLVCAKMHHLRPRSRPSPPPPPPSSPLPRTPTKQETRQRAQEAAASRSARSRSLSPSRRSFSTRF